MFRAGLSALLARDGIAGASGQQDIEDRLLRCKVCARGEVATRLRKPRERSPVHVTHDRGARLCRGDGYLRVSLHDSTYSGP